MRTALVTGASRGIGRAIAERLARDGFRLALGYRTGAAEATETARRVVAQGGEATTLQADVSRAEDVDRLFREAQSALGGLDCVVANAGVPFIGRRIADVSDDEFERIHAVNGRGSFFVLRAAARTVRDGGRIVDVSSSTTVFTAAGMGVHGASKAGAKVLVEVLAAELGERGITVNSVMPGATRTDFLKDAPPAELERIARGSALGKLGEPEDIADVVGFLVSPDARWITGQHLLANGGARV